jgi:hypothetical protein
VRVYIGLDDTDNPDSMGTGRLSRMLAARLEEQGFLANCENTRHQFLLDPAIPYTSHNSSACVGAEVIDAVALEVLGEAAMGFVGEHFHEGANPGVFITDAANVPESFARLGRRAQREVIDLAEVRRLVAPSKAFAWWAGETGQGLIGALGGVGLRSTGQDGRFIGLHGIRELRGVLRAGEIVASSGVESVESEVGEPLPEAALVDTRDWVRPVLRDGRPVLRVRLEGDLWIPAERRSKEL